mmetsp:Transcript_61504/g.144016  ORF Transcript_61504/g.144016 Transcript_61504/m.144016 type:complete len:88 (-) Transcript_61504:274-537(-)
MRERGGLGAEHEALQPLLRVLGQEILEASASLQVLWPLCVRGLLSKFHRHREPTMAALLCQVCVGSHAVAVAPAKVYSELCPGRQPD